MAGAADVSDTRATTPAQTGGGAISAVFGDTVAVFAFGISAIGQAISMAVLIFSGPLEAGLPRAIGSFCIAGGLLAAYIGLRSRIVPAGAVVQDGPAIVMVAVAAVVGARGGSMAVTDVFALLVATTFATGLVMWILGRLRLGGLVRYMPTTVVGAFMAGTGWLLVKGGLDVMVGFGVELSDLGELVSGDVAKFWLPGMAVGVVTWLISRSERLPVIAVGVTIIASLVGFYVITLLASSVDVVEQGGWLIGPFPEGSGVSLVTPDELFDADWRHIVSELPGILSVVAVSVMVMLLNLTGLSAHAGERVDVDVELRHAGVANATCAWLGASPGFHGLGDSILLRRIGATRRLVPAIAGAVMVVFGMVGIGLIGYVPRLIVGALLVTVGAALLEGWIIDMARTVSRIEQFLSVGILVVIASVGILEGIGAGLAAVCGVFIVRYSRVDPIRLGGIGAVVRSRVDRTPRQVEVLQARADRLAVFELQGYLFFGSLTTLDDRFHDLGDSGHHVFSGLDAVVLDFRTVTGIDASGYTLIAQLAAKLQASGSFVVISGLDAALREALDAAAPAIDDAVAWAPTLDQALELSENVQLALAGESLLNDDDPLDLSDALLAEFDELAFALGDVVMAQGDDSDGMMIVREGSLTAWRIDDHGHRQRLRLLSVGALLGEIGLVTGGQRSAEVVAETEVLVLSLSSDQYQALRSTHPELIFELHEFIMRGQAARVISLSEGVARLSR